MVRRLEFAEPDAPKSEGATTWEAPAESEPTAPDDDELTF